MKFCHCTILRPAFGDCTNNGITSRGSLVWLFWDCTPQECEDYCTGHKINPEEILILAREKDCSENERLRAYPLYKRPGCVGPMNGGNFIECWDAPRYKGMAYAVPIPVFDRFETPEEYAALSI